MPRLAGQTIESIVESAVSGAIRAIAPTIQRHIAHLAAEQLERSLAISARPSRAGRATRRARPTEMTRWVADRRARRVPTFVIEMTGGLDTKKKIVAKYGENSAFEKGKPPPKLAR